MKSRTLSQKEDFATITVRVLPEIKQKVEELAVADHRSVNQFMTVLIENAIKEKSN